MPDTRVMKGRHVQTVLTVATQAMFGENGDVANFKRRLSAKVAAQAALAAPSNKRPRWLHYGKPLKQTMKSHTSVRPTSGGGYAYSQVGSTAHYSAYVDQGTGIYGPDANGPYLARVLPPWTVGSPSLYEASWHPQGASHASHQVLIKGQRPQGFMETGMDEALFSMIPPTPTNVAKGQILSAFRWENTPPFFAGNTPVSPLFLRQLDEWRDWRQQAWGVSRDGMRLLGDEKTRLRQMRRNDKRLVERRKAGAAKRAATSAAFRKERTRKRREREKGYDRKDLAKRRERDEVSTKSKFRRDMKTYGGQVRLILEAHLRRLAGPGGKVGTVYVDPASGQWVGYYTPRGRSIQKSAKGSVHGILSRLKERG